MLGQKAKVKVQGHRLELKVSKLLKKLLTLPCGFALYPLSFQHAIE